MKINVKLNKKVKIVIFIFFIIGFAYFNYSFIYQPRNSRIQELDQQITSLENRIEEGKMIAARLEDLKAEYQELTERLEFMEVLLPTEKDIPDFLVLLQETMDEFNIDFTNFSPQNLTQDSGAIYGRLPISLTFNSNYNETIQFLDRLENFPRIVDVRDLRLNPSGDQTDSINISMNMTTYVLMKGSR